MRPNPVDIASVPFFRRSLMAPILGFRRRAKSVMVVLGRIRMNGFLPHLRGFSLWIRLVRRVVVYLWEQGVLKCHKWSNEDLFSHPRQNFFPPCVWQIGHS